MDDDQQFCLRWNNHQSTLISVFDTLLENETLVDCTLAAEGKFLKAHKVVLSACSPYFATLLSEQYDKHPIFILKDVKYQELRAMMDYMYRGEVNISQDQLAALLKAAESLQIKGLSDNRSSGGNNSQKSTDHKQHVPGKLIGGLVGGIGMGSSGGGGIGSGYTLEQTKRARVGPSSIDSQDLSRSREGSSSPTSRRRRKVRRRSIENAMSDIHENSNSSQIQIQQQSTSVPSQSNAASNIMGGVGAIAAAAAAAAAAAGMATSGTGSVLASASASLSQQQQQQQQQHTSATASSSTTPGSLAITAAAAAAAASASGQTSGNLLTTNLTKKTESVSKIIGNAAAAAAADAMNIENLHDDNDKDVINKKDQQQNNHKQQHQRLSKLIDATSSSAAAGKDTEMVIEPKSEYDDDGNDETVEDLTLDDEEMGLDDLDHNAGPSHGGEGSSQGYAQWQVDRSQDEVFMAAQEAQQRDPQVKHDKSEQTDITPDEFELDDCLLESNDIVITQNKDGFVLHVKKVGGNITTSKITAVDEDQAAAAAVAAASSSGGQVHISDVQNVGAEGKSSLTTLTTSHAIRLPSSECELINLKKILPTGHHHQQQQQHQQHHQIHHHQQQHQQSTTTIIQPQLHQHQDHQQHTTSLVTATPQTINTLIGLRGVQIEPKTIHSRIKYSRGKIITQQGGATTVQLEPEKTITSHHELPETTKYEISEIDLNNPQASASIISDLVKYAEIDDIELPDGTKIGIGFAPTEITEHMQHTTQSTQMSADEQSSEQEIHQQHHHQQQQQQQQQLQHHHHHHEQQQYQHQQQQHLQQHEQEHDKDQDDQDDTEEFETIATDQDLSEQLQVEQPTTITKSYTILTTRPMKQEMSTTTTTTTYELSLSDSSMGQSDDIDSKYICRHCGKKYRWKSTLRRHENVECGGKEPCHPCPYCSYKAKQRGNLGVHVRKHHPDKPQLESKRGRK